MYDLKLYQQDNAKWAMPDDTVNKDDNFSNYRILIYEDLILVYEKFDLIYEDVSTCLKCAAWHQIYWKRLVLTSQLSEA